MRTSMKILCLSLPFISLTGAAAAMEKYPEYLETMARQAEPAILAKKGGLFAEASAEWIRDRDNYKFECRRFGDFLTVFIERGANPEPKKNQSYFYGEPRKYTTAINIGGSREIKLIEGHEPDLNGSFSYSGGAVYDDKEKKDATELEYDSHENKTKTAFFKVAPSTGFPYIPTSGRRLFMLDPPPSTQSQGNIMYVSSSGARTTDFKTENYVRAAVDDQIRFEGVNASIFVPAGLGQKIYDQILKEIAGSR